MTRLNIPAPTIVELAREWRIWTNKIPQLQFPADWKIRIWPPFGGALIRFQVNDKISVYLDVKDNLGSLGMPYWEIYPTVDGETERFLMNETDELIEGIKRALA
jgi:hypothetical protein